MNFNELEVSVLKTILSNKRYAVEFITEADDKIFSAGLFRFIKLISSYVKTYKEVPTRKIILEQNAKDTKVCEYINLVWDKIDTTSADPLEFKHDVKKLKDRYAEKLLASLKEQSEEGSSIEDQVKEAQQVLMRVKGLYTAKAFDAKTIKESLKEFTDRYKAKKFDPSIGRGIYTGYSAFDFLTNGLRPAELLIVGGETGSGKSMALLNMGIQMWLQQNIPGQTEDFTKGYNILYFSLEMPYEQCMNRVLSRLADVPYKGIRDGSLTEEQEAKLLEAIKFIHKYPNEFKIVDMPRGATVQQMEIIFNETKMNFEPHVVIIDYLSLMELEESAEQEDWLKLGTLSSLCHEMARVNNCIVLTAVQLNRHTGKGKDAGEAIGAHRIGRSALILTHANHFIQLEKRPQEQQLSDMILHLVKSRDNEGIKFKLRKRFANSALLDMPNDPNDEFANSDDISAQVAKLNAAGGGTGEPS